MDWGGIYLIRKSESRASKNEVRDLIDFEMQMRNYESLKCVITLLIDNRIDANAEL